MEVPVDLSCRAVLVGDVHGQFHDVLNLIQNAGPPSANCMFVFNGDYVDRGAWGFETYFYLLAWKVCACFILSSKLPSLLSHLELPNCRVLIRPTAMPHAARECIKCAV